MRCLFLAPMKPPDHPVPSGDRAIARNWMRVLADLGWDVRLASRLRSFTREGGDEAFAALLAVGEAETRRILADAALIEGASLVFCYHHYCRAPDMIGPELAGTLAVPYVIAEPSLAARRLEGPFRAGEIRARAAMRAARLLACASARDRPGIESAIGPGQVCVTLPAGLDTGAWPIRETGGARAPGPARLLAVAMMREGFKLESYRLLAQALAGLAGPDWRLDIHGDGPARAAVELAFAPLAPRIRFHGQSAPDVLSRAYNEADLFVWPGWREPYGMVYLEAQWHGLPCLAGDFPGLGDALAPESLRVSPCTPERYAEALAALIAEPGALAARRASIRQFVANERSLPAMARQFADAARQAGIAWPGEGKA